MPHIPKTTQPEDADAPLLTKVQRFIKDRYFEFWACLVATVVIIAVVQRLSFDMNQYSDEVFQTIMLLILILGLLTAVVVRQAFMKYSRKPRDSAEKKRLKRHPFKGFAFIWFMPFVAWLILFPWIFAGVFNTVDMGTVGSLFMLLLPLVAAPLLGVLALVFIGVPLEVFGRGFIDFLRGKSRGVGMMGGALYLGVITAFIFVGAGAVSADLPGKFAGPAIIFALFGIPGAYYVKSEELLWLARAMAILIIAVPIIATKLSKKAKLDTQPNKLSE